MDFIHRIINALFQAIKQPLYQWTKPSDHVPVRDAALDVTRSKKELILENALLRQQIIILERQGNRPKLTWRDRSLIVFLTSKLHSWKDALTIVQPETVLDWHRQLFKRVWRQKSKPRPSPGRPPVTDEIVAMIRRIARENLTWGAERIRGELLKLGIQVSKSTIQKYMDGARDPHSSKQTWRTFLRNHADQIWACDFLQTYDLFFRTIFVFVIIELGSRRVVHFGVTRNPSDEWAAQQLREATPFGEGPQFLIRDNDDKFGEAFTRVAEGAEINLLRTPYQTPQANGMCERFLGSLRRECLDHCLILNRRQLHRVIKAYQAYFNHARPHQGIEQQVPCESNRLEAPPVGGKLVSRPVLGGLHHEYFWETSEAADRGSRQGSGYLH